MANKFAGLVFMADHENIDKIIDSFSKNSDMELIFCKTSYSKLWISEKQPEECTA
jgi:hypothetical protein